jgi:hypothetical protein
LHDDLRLVQGESGAVRLDVLLPHSPSHVRIERDAYEFEDDLVVLELFLEIDLSRLVDLEGLQGGFALGQLVEDDARVRDGGHDGVSDFGLELW